MGGGVDTCMSGLRELSNTMLEQYRSDDRMARADLSLPEPENVIRLIYDLRNVIFPGYFNGNTFDGGDRMCILEQLGQIYWRMVRQVHQAIAHDCHPACNKEEEECPVMVKSSEMAMDILNALPKLRELLLKDVEAALDGDPAAHNYAEIILAYPGIFAIIVYRLAHEFYSRGLYLIARLMSEHAHSITGIDIHPGATIGERFFIDHGTGVVVGGTCIIGKNVRVYQGVTLGAASVPKGANGSPIIRDQKRHPTIEDDVTIYPGATILGGGTVIGQGSVIGGNVWLRESVPSGSTVLNKPVVEKRVPGNSSV